MYKFHNSAEELALKYKKASRRPFDDKRLPYLMPAHYRSIRASGHLSTPNSCCPWRRLQKGCKNYDLQWQENPIEDTSSLFHPNLQNVELGCSGVIEIWRICLAAVQATHAVSSSFPPNCRHSWSEALKEGIDSSSTLMKRCLLKYSGMQCRRVDATLLPKDRWPSQEDHTKSKRYFRHHLFIYLQQIHKIHSVIHQTHLHHPQYPQIEHQGKEHENQSLDTSNRAAVSI